MRRSASDAKCGRRLASHSRQRSGASIYLTNESLGAAFNPRCGILMKGYAFPYRGLATKGHPTFGASCVLVNGFLTPRKQWVRGGDTTRSGCSSRSPRF